MGLKEIANKCGLASVDSMRRTFLRVIGVTAGEYPSRSSPACIACAKSRLKKLA
jgi:AraC-like DNA-binding protein